MTLKKKTASCLCKFYVTKKKVLEVVNLNFVVFLNNVQKPSVLHSPVSVQKAVFNFYLVVNFYLVLAYSILTKTRANFTGWMPVVAHKNQTDAILCTDGFSRDKLQFDNNFLGNLFQYLHKVDIQKFDMIFGHEHYGKISRTLVLISIYS